MIRRFAILTVLVTAPAVHAAEILSIKVNSEKGVYTMTSEVWFDATIEQIYEVYRYWDYAPDFSSAIAEARDMEPDASGRPQFYIRNKGCVLFFCKSFERQGYVESEHLSELRAFANPDTSDFHISNESWRFSAKRWRHGCYLRPGNETQILGAARYRSVFHQAQAEKQWR